MKEAASKLFELVDTGIILCSDKEREVIAFKGSATDLAMLLKKGTKQNDNFQDVLVSLVLTEASLDKSMRKLLLKLLNDMNDGE